jgi:hypothetical protein
LVDRYLGGRDAGSFEGLRIEPQKSPGLALIHDYLVSLDSEKVRRVQVPPDEAPCPCEHSGDSEQEHDESNRYEARRSRSAPIPASA